MVNRQTIDPTAGESVRGLREQPGAPRPIRDVTDVRYGELEVDGRLPEEREQILDPTDARYGEPLD